MALRLSPVAGLRAVTVAPATTAIRIGDRAGQVRGRGLGLPQGASRSGPAKSPAAWQGPTLLHETRTSVLSFSFSLETLDASHTCSYPVEQKTAGNSRFHLFSNESGIPALVSPGHCCTDIYRFALKFVTQNATLGKQNVTGNPGAAPHPLTNGRGGPAVTLYFRGATCYCCIRPRFMRIIPLSIPTPFYVGDVNVYLVREEPITLIDAGPKTETATMVLRARLADHGIKFADIRRIVLTHAHEDHCGLAKRVRDEAKDAEVFIHQWETGHLFGRLAHEEHRQLMLRSGVPDAVFEEMRALYENISLLTDSLADNELRPLQDEMELEFDGGALKVLHTPGHTPGSSSFLREADRTLICGDCVLKRITPNPILAPHPLDPTKRFRRSANIL